MNEEYLSKYEQSLHNSLRTLLTASNAVDSMEADAPDLEGVWQTVCQSYLGDGVREFAGYPTVSVGWMMYVGMALAQQWDADWTACTAQPDMYTALRDKRGFDCMDEYICEEVLSLDAAQQRATAKLVGDCATIAVHALQREQFEPGSPLAFHSYVCTLHQMYIAGVQTQLHRMGYKMTLMDGQN